MKNPFTAMHEHTLTKLKELASDQLEPGEQYLVAVPLERLGEEIATTALLDDWQSEADDAAPISVSGLMDKAMYKFETRHDGRQFHDVPPSPITIGDHGAIVAATAGRLLVFERTLTGKPNGLLGSWPIPDDGMPVETHARMLVGDEENGGGSRIETIRIVLPDHTLFGGEADLMVHGKEVNQLAEALQRAA